MKANLIKPQRNRLTMFLTVIVLIGISPTQAAPSACPSVFESPDSPLHELLTGLWRKTGSNDLFSGFRANAPHFWNWLYSVSSLPAFSIRGTATGDPHILNFGDVPLKEGGRDLALIDLDDSGVETPLIGDFLRYLIGNQISAFKVDAKDLFDAYKLGASGINMKNPPYLENILSKSDSDFIKRQEAYLHKLSSMESFKPHADLLPISEAPLEIQTIYKQAQGTFEKLMKDYTILDRGYKVKKGGGSQRVPRFWFLVKKADDRHIWEFKLAEPPSTSFITPQPKADIRFQAVAEIYRPKTEVQGPFQYVNAGNYFFLLRERFDNYMDLDPQKNRDPLNLEEGRQMSLYLANKLGQWHGDQKSTSDLNSFLNSTNAFADILSLTTEYIRLIEDENSK